ncbi:hypothetical protein HYH02_012920 [Chlamydomonas schloesseri]|uniref:Glycosyltransferase n=1 Tax=Chlamydomonas schloesseri TaxID=2026947 RepID=A0A835SV12_9CHLO|nr:hypothetical protein HYH02_012920 [Chlamydomonas schloesseri]|eukprot:KAG2432346.1 hypothetical protein HYH02_012920 [Chlamydomonas schloesseri]
MVVLPVKTQSVRWLLVLLGGLLLLYFQLHFFASATRRYKDCSVGWVSVAQEAQSRLGQHGQGQGHETQGGRKGLGERRRVQAKDSRTGSSSSGSSSSSASDDASAASRERRLDIVLVSMSSGKKMAPMGDSTGDEADAPGGSKSATSGGRGDGSGDTALQAAGADGAVVNARAAQFSGLLDITGPNKQQYAALHGYRYVDASALLDRTRPASWSKIPAVMSVLDSCDWVFWVDADTLITNMSTPLERLLPAGPVWAAAAGAEGRAGEPVAAGLGLGVGLGLGGPDLILTADSTGVNAGVWLIRGRGCAWCRSFLTRWWSMESFIRRDPHDSKSGDNDALKHMVATMDSAELGAHVGIAPQCAFNSYLWRPSLRNWLRYLANPHHILTGLWQPGDFLLHPAGVHHKKEVLLRFLRDQQRSARLAFSDAFASALRAAAGGISSGGSGDGGMGGVSSASKARNGASRRALALGEAA